jgi:hypothetical protein
MWLQMSRGILVSILICVKKSGSSVNKYILICSFYRKIAWFNISDLPRHKTDFDGCTLQGFRPNNFYGVLPAVDFIRKFSNEQIKKRQFSQKKLSAFQPVIPKGNK